MITFADVFSATWSKPLVWTLIHSLWQGLSIMTVLMLTLRLIPSQKSAVRYLMTTAALSMILICSASTYFYLSSQTSDGGGTLSSLMVIGSSKIVSGSPESSAGFLHVVGDAIERNLYLITLIWMSGAFLFSVRIATGFFYIGAMRRSSNPIQDEWNNRLQKLAEQINLKRIVRLAESTQITVPFVIGYFKPLILIPTGMLSGLSVEQMESILVHELMHIKRNDYIVNIIQTFVEAIFFFNPFVWIVSSIIRREREHCCDDEVVKHGNVLAYAHALTQLEELNLANRSLVLSLAENKNQLLKRIKRIMEKSVQSYSVKERIIPVVLLLVGLTCASWLTIKAPVNDLPAESKKIVALDSPKPEKATHYTRKITVVRDEEGNPKEEIVELFETDDDEVSLGDWEIEMPAIAPMPAMEFSEPFTVGVPAIAAVPPMPDMDFTAPFMVEVPEVADVSLIPAIAPIPDMMEMFYINDDDTTPDKRYTLKLRGDFDKFSKEYDIKFKEKFGEFYNKNKEEMRKLMEEVAREIQVKNSREWEEAAMTERSMYEAQRNAEMARAQMDHNRIAMKEQQAAMEQAQISLRKVQREQEVHQLQMEKELRAMENNMKAFEKELKEQLIKDGYIGKNDDVETINWSGDDVLTVNGKKIKETDKKKYSDLHNKYFKEPKRRGRPE